MARKDDRRIIRTRKMLRDAMHQLILERGYDDINIQDVTDRADLGRATFYLHYREKDDLLVDLIDQRFDEFVSNTLPVVSSCNGVLDLKAIQKLFDIAENNFDFYRIMAIGKGGTIASNRLHALIRIKVKERLDQIQAVLGNKLSFPQDFLENYLSGALLSLIYWWLENDMPYTSQEMVQMYYRLNEQLSKGYLSQGEVPAQAEIHAGARRTKNMKAEAKSASVNRQARSQSGAEQDYDSKADHYEENK